MIRLLKYREQFCDTVFKNIVWCHSGNNAPHHLKSASFVKAVPDLENHENVHTIIVFYDLMDSSYSTKLSEIFTDGSHLGNISLVLFTQNVFHQGSQMSDISLNSYYIVMFKNPRDKNQIVHMARQV